MAFVESFERGTRSNLKRQPSTVTCHYSVADHGGTRLIQFDTYGSETRANPGKQSQTLQLDAERAKQLVALLKAAFNIEA